MIFSNSSKKEYRELIQIAATAIELVKLIMINERLSIKEAEHYFTVIMATGFFLVGDYPELGVMARSYYKVEENNLLEKELNEIIIKFNKEIAKIEFINLRPVQFAKTNDAKYLIHPKNIGRFFSFCTRQVVSVAEVKVKVPDSVLEYLEKQLMFGMVLANRQPELCTACYDYWEYTQDFTPNIWMKNIYNLYQPNK